MLKLLSHIGTRYTVAQAWRIIKRAKRFAILREDQEIDAWLEAIRRVRP